MKNTISASVAVMMMWLVTVKPKGISPNMLSSSTNMKIVNTKGKNRIPSWPAVERSMSATNS